MSDAAVVTTGIAPTADVLAQNLAVGGNTSNWGFREARTYGQTFTIPGNFTLTGMAIQNYAPANYVGYTFTVKVLQFDNSWTGSGNATGTLLAQESGVAASGGAGQFFRITLDTPLTLNGNTQYGFAITAYHPESGQANWNLNLANPYADGLSICNGDGGNTFGACWSASTDTMFVVQGMLPEPATMSLLGLGVLGLLRRK
jgi:hypothetical protein